MENTHLLTYLNDLLRPQLFRDYCPNGLQVEGKKQVNKVITGVTASQALIDAAIAKGADAIFVHHGYFWKNESQTITGMKRNRIKALLHHDINLYAYHLPLDAHPTLGNNAQLAARLGISGNEPLQVGKELSVVRRGDFPQSLTVSELKHRIEQQLQRSPLIEASGPEQINSVAWCTGGGQGYIELAAEAGIDVFITGEASEQTIHTAREMGLHFIAAGHHATERYGAMAVGEHLAAELDLAVEFVDIDNPV